METLQFQREFNFRYCKYEKKVVHKKLYTIFLWIYTIMAIVLISTLLFIIFF